MLTGRAARRAMATTAAQAAATGGGRGAPKPLARFGVIADVQYADVEDMYNFARTTRRGYRGALGALRRAVAEWDRQEVDFVVDLGDMIDQLNETQGVSHAMLSRVLAEFDRLRCRHYHLVGNHELYNFTRAEIEATIPNVLGEKTKELYHSFNPAVGWRCIVIDTYDMHCIADRETPRDIESVYQLLEKHNPNNVRAPRGTENWVAGLSGLAARWAPYNGGVRAQQLRWLEDELAAAAAADEKVVVFGHVPLGPGAGADSTLVWNHSDVLERLHASRVCVAVFAGHCHRGGYVADAHGVHHITLPSPLNITEDRDTAHAVIELYGDALVVRGSGLVPSYTIPVGGVQSMKASL